MEELLSASQAAKILRVSKATVVRWLNAGKLEGKRIGNAWAVPAATVERCAAELASGPPAGRDPNSNEPFTPREVADAAGISVSLVHHHLNYGSLQGDWGEDGKWLIPAKEARRFIAMPRAVGRPKGTKGVKRKKGGGRAKPAGGGEHAAE